MAEYEAAIDRALAEEEIAELEREIAAKAPSTSGEVVYASIVAFFAWMFSVYDFLIFGTLLPLIQDSFGWTTATAAFVSTWVSVGTFLVSLTVGPITDYLGRRNALMITTAGAAVSSGLAALTFHPVYLVIVRSLSGLGYSEQAVNTTYLSEIYGPKNRGFIYSFVQGGWPIGAMFAALMASLAVPVVGWRGTFAIAFLPAVVIVLLRIKLKESPRYLKLSHVRKLAKAGKKKEANQLGKLWGIDTAKANRFVYGQLVHKDVVRHTTFLSLAFMANWFGNQIFLVLFTTVASKGLGVDFTTALWMLVASNLISYVGYITMGKIGDIIGRRETIAIGWLASGILWGLMILVAKGFWPVFLLYAFGLFFQIGVYSALFTYMGESFPTRMRGTAAAWVNATGQLGAIFGGLLFFAILAGREDSAAALKSAAFWAGVVPIFVSALLMWGCFRVKPGQVLEEIAT